MVRLKDVAYLAGYDISTVSKVLQGGNIHVSAEARERITKAATKLGYQPNLMARGLRTRRTGAIVLGFPCLDHPMYPAITEGAEKAAAELGVVLFVYKYPAEGGAEAMINLVRQGRADGILLAGEVDHPDFLKYAKESQVPVVTLNRHDGENATSVVLDDEAGFSAQAEYLADLGHGNIVFVGVRDETRSSRFCERAFTQTLRDRGIEFGDHHLLRAEFDGCDAALVAKKIAELRPGPTAVAAASLNIAVGLIKSFSLMGIRVPQDMSVIGYHDAAQSEWITPTLTTVKMPSFEHGYLGLLSLAELLKASVQEPSETICTPATIVERESCRRILGEKDQQSSTA